MTDNQQDAGRSRLVTDYRSLYDLRRADPLALVQMHRECGQPDLAFATFLRRRFPDDAAWTEVDWDAVARSVEADAAAMAAILAEYPERADDEADADADAGDDEYRCAVCDDGDICRTAFETDAADVADEAEAPLADVMRWMHQNELHSNVDSIGAMADAYRQAAAAMRIAAAGAVLDGVEAQPCRA